MAPSHPWTCKGIAEALTGVRIGEVLSREIISPGCKMAGRGVADWSDGQGDGRIVVVTLGFFLISLDADTGLPK